MWEIVQDSKIDQRPQDLQRDSEIQTAAEEKAGVGGGGSELRHLYHKRRISGNVISKDYIWSIHAQKYPGACSFSSAFMPRGIAATLAASFDISSSFIN